MHSEEGFHRKFLQIFDLFDLTILVCDFFFPKLRGMVVKLRDKFRHPECYTCSNCDVNLKQKGHFFVEDQIYCEKHARERVTPPEGYDVVTVFPK